MDEKEKLALDIDEFSYGYDPYEYGDTVDDRQEQIAEVYDLICKKDEALRKWLQDIIDEEDPGDEDGVAAAELLARLDAIWS